MNDTIKAINAINDDIVNPNLKLQDILLKVKVLAHKIKNPKLKEWVDCELDGYVGKTVPDYRKIPVGVEGRVIEHRIGYVVTIPSTPLPIHRLNKKYDGLIKEVLDVPMGINELESSLRNGGDLQSPISTLHTTVIASVMAQGTQLLSAWYQIPFGALNGILGSIKVRLLDFLLKLADEIGENDNLDIMAHRPKIDQLFEKSIGNITAGTVNISTGNESVQTVNSGDHANMNIAKGNKNEQSISIESREDLSKFMSELRSILGSISISREEKEDILSQIAIIEKQLERPRPKAPLIKATLNTIHGLALGVAGNALSPVIIERLSGFISTF